MKSPGVRWALTFIRYGLLAVALVFLYNAVPWYDYLALAGGGEVRLLQERPDGRFLVLRDGAEQEIGLDQVKVLEVDGDRVPKIRYGVAGVVRSADWRQALIAIILFLPVPFLSSVRLVWMLGIQDVRLSLWNSTKLTFAGNFFNFALPGTTGGDLIKAYYVTRFTHHKTEAVTTVVLDRVIGLMGLMFLSTVMFIAGWDRIAWNPLSYRNGLAVMLACIWAGLLVGALFVFSQRLRHWIRLPALAAKLPASEHLLRIGRATVKMRYHKTLLIGSILITIVLQLFVLFAAYVMSRALGMHGAFALYFVCVPIGFLIAAIPISPPQGFGVMEWVYVMFFTQGALNPKSAAFAFALANRLTQLVWAVPGALVPLLGAHLPTKAELADLEDSSTNDLVAERPAGSASPSGHDPSSPSQ